MPAMHARPPKTIDVSTVVSAATAPASRSPSAGPVVHTAIPTPSIRPSIGGGVAILRIDCRNTPLTMSAAPATTSMNSEIARPFTRPKTVIATPQPTIARQSATPWRGTLRAQPLVARDERAGKGRRVEQSEHVCVAVESLVDERGEQRDGHPEDHRDEIGDERSLQDRSASQVAEPIADCLECHAVFARDRDRTHRRYEQDAQRERGDIHEVGPAEAETGDQDTCDDRAEEQSRAGERRFQRGGRGDLLGAPPASARPSGSKAPRPSTPRSTRRTRRRSPRCAGAPRPR